MGKLGHVITLSSYVATAYGSISMSAGCQTPGRIAPIWARSPSRFASRTAMGHSRNRTRGYGDWLQRRRVRPRMTPCRGSSSTSALQVAASRSPANSSSPSSLRMFGAATCRLYELVASASPFAAEGPAETMQRVLHDLAPSLAEAHPDVPLALASLIDHLLAKDPAHRPQSAHEVAVRLHALIPGRCLPEHGKGMGEQCNRGNTSNGEPARGQLARKVSQHS